MSKWWSIWIGFLVLAVGLLLVFTACGETEATLVVPFLRRG